MTVTELLDALRDLDAQLHSPRVTDYYRGQDARSRERFVALRAWTARALADATRARIEEIADALTAHDAELRRGMADARDALRHLDDAVRALNVLADVLTVLAQAVPGIIDQVLP